MRAQMCFASMFVAIGVGSAQAQGADEFLVGPVEYVQDVSGTNVTVRARSYFKISTVDNKIYLKARAIANLADLQSKIGTIVDRFNLPRENCRSYSANNPVVSIPRKELLLRDGAAIFSIGGNVTMWDCRENPIPKTAVEWCMKSIGPIKTKVPCVRSWPGDPIKNKLVSQSFDADLPVLLVKNNDFAVGLQFSKPDIELKGQYAFITKGVLSIAGVDINQKAYDALQKAIDPQKLRLVVPEEFQIFNPTVEQATFFDDAGSLAAEIRFSALIPAEKVTEMIKELIDKKL